MRSDSLIARDREVKLTETEQVSGADQELARIADMIVALTDARKGERQPYLVSALGIDLGEDLRTLKRRSESVV